MLVNTIVFTCFYFFTRSYLQPAHALEVSKVNIALFLITTALCIVIRFVVMWLAGRQFPEFSLKELSKVFVALIGAGIVTYLFVYFLTVYIRTAIIAVFTFLFSGLFYLFGKGITPAIDALVDLRDRIKFAGYLDEEPEVAVGDFQMDEKHSFFGDGIVNLDLVISILIITAIVVVFIFIARKRKVSTSSMRGPSYILKSLGRKKDEEKLVYDYSLATNAVRDAYKSFEQDALNAKFHRFTGETVKEWFSRMGWGQTKNFLRHMIRRDMD